MVRPNSVIDTKLNRHDLWPVCLGERWLESRPALADGGAGGYDGGLGPFPMLSREEGRALVNKTIAVLVAVVVVVLVLPVVVVQLRAGPAGQEAGGAGAGPPASAGGSAGDPYATTTVTIEGETLELTALGAAILAGDRSRVQAFLAGGADLNRPIQRRSQGRPLRTTHAVPLAVAAVAQNAATVEFIGFLVERGADVNLGLPLHAAVASQRADIVRAVIAAGANVNARNRSGYTALGGAERLGSTSDIIQVLREHGAVK